MSSLEGKRVALLGLGHSQLDYHLSITHSEEYDEVWAVNSMCAVVNADRVFMMDPASRFFDSDDAGGQTEVIRKILPTLNVLCIPANWMSEYRRLHCIP